VTISPIANTSPLLLQFLSLERLPRPGPQDLIDLIRHTTRLLILKRGIISLPSVSMTLENKWKKTTTLDKKDMRDGVGHNDLPRYIMDV
jgi:hypothetical protein